MIVGPRRAGKTYYLYQRLSAAHRFNAGKTGIAGLGSGKTNARVVTGRALSSQFSPVAWDQRASW